MHWFPLEDSRPYVDVPIAGTEMTFKSLLDPGSTTSIMTVEQYKNPIRTQNLRKGHR